MSFRKGPAGKILIDEPIEGQDIVPGVARGRAFSKEELESGVAGPGHKVRAKATATLSGIKVIRADGSEEIIK